jgi:hypothetical protein
MKQKVLRGRKQKQFITVFDWRASDFGCCNAIAIVRNYGTVVNLPTAE